MRDTPGYIRAREHDGLVSSSIREKPLQSEVGLSSAEEARAQLPASCAGPGEARDSARPTAGLSVGLRRSTEPAHFPEPPCAGPRVTQGREHSSPRPRQKLQGGKNTRGVLVWGHI